ncbi:5-oxoprolinase subunit PxpA [Alteromonas flava]|uniref:5-oxoprolinase subunit PxpA n=1 Tax=Alteromonas flava TaxID=2048003 RepID=UPI000C293B5A|nr:5-oxoprolinase subunit PxpA [Alteromonas flava]
MHLNCDLGEDYGAWKMPVDEQIMQYIDQANIACGFHAGDPLVIKRTIQQALAHKVAIGAHPSYPDRLGFGRRSMKVAHAELVAMIQYQVAALQSMCRLAGTELTYVKPHGALYNDFTVDANVRRATMEAVSAFGTLRLMVQGTGGERQQTFTRESHEFGLSLIFEGFIDRRYQPDGTLTPRSQPGAVLSFDEALEQAKLLIEQHRVVTSNSKSIDVPVTSLCIHGDNPESTALASAVRHML